jgi:hypothetical protein
MRTSHVAVAALLGALVVDNIHHRVKTKELEKIIDRQSDLTARQSLINNACLDTLHVCGDVAHNITENGLKILEAKNKLEQTKSRPMRRKSPERYAALVKEPNASPEEGRLVGVLP